MIAPCTAISCSNVKLGFSGMGVSQHEIISCDNISSFEISPEISFLTVVRKGNSLDVSGNITGKIVYGYITVFDMGQSGQVSTRAGIRIPVSVNGGTPTVTPTLTVKPSISPTTPTTIQTKPVPKPTYTPLDVIPLIVGLIGVLWWRFDKRKKGGGDK